MCAAKEEATKYKIQGWKKDPDKTLIREDSSHIRGELPVMRVFYISRQKGKGEN